MLIVFQYFRSAATIATHPGSVFSDLRTKDPVALRRAEMQEIVDYAMKTLRQHSPVGSGKDPHPGLYRDSHKLFVNGNDVDDLTAWRPGDEIEISNPLPYARIIEIGDGKYRVPNYVYDQASYIVAQKYGDIAKIAMTYMPLKFGAVEEWAKYRGTFGKRKRFTARGGMNWLVRQPAMIIMGIN